MRVEVLGNEIRPGDEIWFSGQRKPSRVVQVEEQQGAEKLWVIHGEDRIWYMQYDTGKVNKYVPDPPEEVEEEVFLDPDGNPT